jgi:L-ribulose-5-phosphate 3-epimerase
VKKGIWLGGFPPDMPLADRFALAQDAGFDGVEVVADATMVASDARVDEIAELASRCVPVCSVMCGASGWLGSPDPDDRDRTLAQVEQTIRATARMGADTLLVIPAVVNERIGYEQAWVDGQAGLRAVLGVAEEHRVCLAIENVWNKFLLSPLEMGRFVDEIGHPLAAAYFDVGNVLAFGYPEQWIDVLGARIRRVHLKDFRRKVGTIDGFVQLLEGDVDWPAVMAALRRVGYDGFLTSEVSHYRHSGREGVFAISRAIDALPAL